MARKRFSDEDILKVLRQIEVDLASGTDIQTACRSAGVSTAVQPPWFVPFQFEVSGTGGRMLRL